MEQITYLKIGYTLIIITLKKIGAMGLVVSVKTTNELSELRQLAPDLTLMPTPGDDLASRLNLAHYPALLTSEGLSQ